jgi:hypothetical protein
MYAAVTRDEAQRSIRTFYEAVKFADQIRHRLNQEGLPLRSRLIGLLPKRNLCERPLKYFGKQILAKRKISDPNCLSRRRVLESPAASLRFDPKDFRQSEKRFGQQPVYCGHFLKIGSDVIGGGDQ